MNLRASRDFLQMISSAMLSQGLLSAGNFLVGLTILRRTPHAQYAYYVLVVTGATLLTQLQLAFIQPALVRCLASADRSGRRAFVGGAYREQRRWLLLLAAASSVLLLAVWRLKLVDAPTAAVTLAGLFAAMAMLYREYFRMVLLAYRLPLQALRVDVFYVALLCIGAYLATVTPAPAVTASVTLGVAAAIGGRLMSHMVWRHEGWVIEGSPKIIGEIAPLGKWAVTGAAIHWTFSQGFIYVVAGTLGVGAVAAISATRLMLSPVNLMSSGLGSMTFPTVSRWLLHQPVREVFRRLSGLAAGIAALGSVYIVVMWLYRDWIFLHVTKVHFEHRDALVLLWAGVFLLMAVRDQMLYLPAACGRYRIMAWLTLATAIFSLVMCYACMRLFGVVGALIGVFAGEAFNILGFIALSLREIAIAQPRMSATEAGS